MISKEEVCIVHTILVGMLPEADFVHLLLFVCYLYSETISQKSGCLVGTCGQLKLAGTNF
jgi:hypothetical protein